VELKSLSLTQRLLAGAGCVVVLVLLAAAGALLYWERQAARSTARDLGTAPAGWTDSVRMAGRLPDLGEFVLPRTDSADGAWVVYDTARAFRLGGIQHAYRAMVGSETPNEADSTLWRALAADTSLDDWAGAARARQWHATERLLATRPPDARPNVMLIPIPAYVPARDAARALVIRGLMRLARGDRIGARADLAAATGLGEQMVRREPTFIGMLIGRATIASGLTGWQRYGVVTRDTALTGRAARLHAWAVLRPAGYAGFLVAAPDSAIAIARDASLVLGARTFALEQLLLGWFVRPRGLLFGPPSDVTRAIEALTTDPDPDMALMAGVAAATAHRLNLFGLPALLKESGPGPTR